MSRGLDTEGPYLRRHREHLSDSEQGPGWERQAAADLKFLLAALKELPAARGPKEASLERLQQLCDKRFRPPEESPESRLSPMPSPAKERGSSPSRRCVPGSEVEWSAHERMHAICSDQPTDGSYFFCTADRPSFRGSAPRSFLSSSATEARVRQAQRRVQRTRAHCKQRGLQTQ